VGNKPRKALAAPKDEFAGEAPKGRMKGGVGEVRRSAGFQIAKMYT
jgi:hypothetical protein